MNTVNYSRNWCLVLCGNSNIQRKESLGRTLNFFFVCESKTSPDHAERYIISLKNGSYGHKSKHKTFFLILNIMDQLTSIKSAFLLLFFNCSRTVYQGLLGCATLIGRARPKNFFFRNIYSPAQSFQYSQRFATIKHNLSLNWGTQQTIFHGYSVCGAPFFTQI